MTDDKLIDRDGLIPARATGWRYAVNGSDRDLFAVLHTFWRRRAHLRYGADTRPRNKTVTMMFRLSAEMLAPITTRMALVANGHLVEKLIGQRWILIKEAREDGASWAEIGEDLGMSKQAAQDWYRRRVDDQEKFVPDFDLAEARGVLDEK